jgi:hypothetical protein
MRERPQGGKAMPSEAEVEAAVRGIELAIDEDHRLRYMPKDDRLRLARAALEAAERVREANKGREYDPNVAPCDDAEFGMKP